MKRMEVLGYVSAVLFAGSIALPDTNAGSPRSIAIAVAGLLTAVIAALAHGTQGTSVSA